MTHGPIRQVYVYDLDKNLTGLTVRSENALTSPDNPFRQNETRRRIETFCGGPQTG